MPLEVAINEHVKKSNQETMLSVIKNLDVMNVEGDNTKK